MEVPWLNFRFLIQHNLEKLNIVKRRKNKFCKRSSMIEELDSNPVGYFRSIKTRKYHIRVELLTLISCLT